MMKTEKAIASEVGDPLDSGLAQLIHAWRVAEDRIVSMNDNFSSTDRQEPWSSDTIFPGASTAADDEQLRLLRRITEHPAATLTDLLAKLSIWKTTICPEESDEASLTELDLLVLSVWRDLRHLGA